jgi:WD40 repeat protein/predicted GNAT family N-acyltransferase
MEIDIAFKEVDCSDSVSLDRIGKLRYDVWLGEKSLNQNMFPDGSWLDPTDKDSSLTRHFVAELKGEFVAAARLVTHASIATADVDINLWLASGKELAWPVCDLGRLVVRHDCRRRGLAKILNAVRIKTARSMGAGSIIVTASAGNASLLKAMGFLSIGEEVIFPNRPATTFYALQYTFYSPHLSELMSNELVASEVLSYLPEARGLLTFAQAARGFDATVVNSGAWSSRLKRATSWAPLYMLDAWAPPPEPNPVGAAEETEESDVTDFSMRRRFLMHARTSLAFQTGSVKSTDHFSGHVDGASCVAVHPGYGQCVDDEANAYAFSGVPFLASGSMDGSILLHERGPSHIGDHARISTGKPVAALMGHVGAVTAIRWIVPETLISASFDGKVKSWDVGSSAISYIKQPNATWYHGNGDERILALDCQASGHITVTGGRDGLLGLHDFRLQRQISSFASGESCVYSVAINSALLLAGTPRGGVHLYDLRKLGPSSTNGFAPPSCPLFLLEERFLLPSCRPIMAIALAGNCFAAGCKDGDIAVSCVLSSGNSNDRALLLSHYKGIRSLAFAQEGKTLVSSANDSTIRLWNISEIVSGSRVKTCSSLSPTAIIRSHRAQVPQVLACRASFFSASIDKMVMEHKLLIR